MLLLRCEIRIAKANWLHSANITPNFMDTVEITGGKRSEQRSFWLWGSAGTLMIGKLNIDHLYH